MAARGSHTSSHRIKKSALMIAVFALCVPCALSQHGNLSVSEMEFNLLVDENKLFKLIQIGEYEVPLTTVHLVAQHDAIVQLFLPEVPLPPAERANSTARREYDVGEYEVPLTVHLVAQHDAIVQLFPPEVPLPPAERANSTARREYDVCVLGKSPGHSEVTFNVTPSGYIDVQRLVMRITVMYSRELHWLSVVMGWVYFAAWSVSFYPQVWTNYRRRSVVGLNFDFLALNLLGFSMYSLFNCGLYFSKVIQDQYLQRHPTGLNPVQLNDVFFSLHAAFATIVTIVQCFRYERAEQSVSLAGRAVLTVLSGVVLVSAVLVATGTIVWLDFLYYCSYVKLCITLIKYLPQAYMNYARQSTVGWSIGNIFLDLVGGLLSVLQMLLNAYNYDDWHSIFGDLTKFGLGLFSLIFDIFFILQHYVFYREGRQFLFVESSDKELGLMEGSTNSKDALTNFYHWNNAEEKKTKADIPA